jgi:hypothetical protein
MMIQRLLACALGLACAIAILFLVVTQVRSADFDKDWLLEDLTCGELLSGYQFEVEILKEIITQYDNCLLFYKDAVPSPVHGDLHCALIKQEGMYVRGVVNDLVGVYRAKHCGEQ